MSANVENKMLIVGGNIPATFVEIIPKIYALDNCWIAFGIATFMYVKNIFSLIIE